MRLHIAGDAGIAANFLGALEDENVSQHRTGDEPQRASPADKEIEVRVESPPARSRRGVFARGLRLRHHDSLRQMDARHKWPARVPKSPDQSACASVSASARSP